MQDINYLIKGETPDWAQTDVQRSEYETLKSSFKKFMMVFLAVSAIVYFSPGTVKKIPLIGKYLGRKKSALVIGVGVLLVYMGSVSKKVSEIKG